MPACQVSTLLLTALMLSVSLAMPQSKQGFCIKQAHDGDPCDGNVKHTCSVDNTQILRCVRLPHGKSVWVPKQDCAQPAQQCYCDWAKWDHVTCHA